MAPTFTHGKNWGVLAGRFNLGALVSDSNQSWSVDTAGCNVYGDTDHVFQAGQRNGQVTMNGYHDASTSVNEYRDTWGQALGSSSPIPITWGPGAIGSLVRLVSGIPTAADVTAPIADMVKATFTAQAAGPVRPGIMAKAVGQRATTGVSAGQDWGGAASAVAQEIFAHLHVTATSGTVTTATIKVQHSSQVAGTYTDVLTFTNVTGTGSERKSATGVTLKRYVRETLSALTGAGAKVTYAVSFARPMNTSP